VTKTQVVLTSLVAALPGAVLSYLLIMVFLSYGGGKTVMMQALAAITLLLSIAAVLAPAGLWVFGGPAAPRKKNAGKDAEGGDEAGEDAAEVEEVEAADEDEVQTVAAASDEALEIESGEVEGFEDEVAFEDEAAVEDVEEADVVTADSDAFEDVFDDFEDEEPDDKKKKHR